MPLTRGRAIPFRRSARGGGGKKFRAMDKESGETIWETELGAGVTGAPMTYMYKGGQYVVVAIGGTIVPPNSRP